MIKEFSTPDQLEYQFHPALEGVCNFQIKASNDAHIALTTGPEVANPMYEVFIGGWRNTKSVIRKNRMKPDVVEVETPHILSENEFRGFWIRWNEGKISVGKKDEECPFMIYEDPEQFHVGFVGFCTGWGASGSWIVEVPQNQPYWEKRANGELPQGAVSAGTDNGTGDVIFIARAEHEGALVPGKFVPSHRVTYVPWGGAEHAKHEYEILCGAIPQWVQDHGGSIPPNAFEGGRSEEGEVLYIGRVSEENKLAVGKVQVSHKVCYIPYDGKELAYSDYEVLVL